MQTATQLATEPTIAIPLSSLIHSKAYNVRKTEPKKDLAMLKASITARGILQNLVVLPVADGDKYEVIAGGRRLAALKELSKEGTFAKDFAVPCLITDEAHAREISLSENVIRTAMHPADEYEAWAKLADEDNMTVEQIAAHSGVSVTVVKQRLLIGRASPVVIKAYRNEEMPLESLMAFTLCEDHARQEEVYKRFKGSHELSAPHYIRRALTEKFVKNDHRFAKFVGVEAYEAAGGAVRRDLFSEQDDCYLEDVPLLQKLASEKLEQIVTVLQGAWKWAEARESFGWGEQRDYRIIRSHQLEEVPEKLTKKRDSLQEKLEALQEAEADEADYDKAARQLEQTEAKIAEYFGFTPEEKAIAGCVVTIGWDGDADITYGLVRPEDEPAQVESELSGDTEGEENEEGEESDDDADEPGYRPGLTDARADAKFDYTSALQADLKDDRLRVIRLYMANDYEVAFDTALYVMCLRDLNPSYYYGHEFLQIRASKVSVKGSQDTVGKELHAKEQALLKALPLEWMNHKNELERYEAFCGLSIEDKQRLFAACIARALSPQLAGEASKSHLFDAVGKRLGVDVAAHWRPTKDNYFDRVTKKQALACAAQVLGEEWAKKHANQKKEDVVLPLDAAFLKPDSNQHTPEQQEQLKAWLPEGMAF